jgi:dTMP kinase
MGDRVAHRGWLISLEGLDGVGKTTQIERLGQWLRGRGVEVLSVREPGGTPFGETLRELVLHRVEAASPMAEFLVFASARAELMDSLVLPALNRGSVVLMDRFVDSSVAYQAFGHGLNVEAVQTVNRIATGGRQPDWTIWLKGEPFTNTASDRMEQRDQAYFSRVQAGYAWLVQQEPERWTVIDCHQNPDIIFDTLCQRIDGLILAN